MTGRLLLRLAGRVVHADTLARVVEPAVADLQFEATVGRWRDLLRAYIGVGHAVLGAVWLDFAWDRRTPAWAEELSELARLGLLVAAYQLSMAVLILGFYAPLHKPLSDWLAGGLTNGSVATTTILVFATAACALASRAHAPNPRTADSTDA